MSEYTITYTYDYNNRVIRKERSDGAVVEFEYDPMGRLIKKTVRKPDMTITVDMSTGQFVTYDSLNNIFRAAIQARGYAI